ncbi:hypothetical protein [Pedobacter jeongneungensis]|uniref:hypothetical protein n=1 Tax=Pedobacter jeongneungensis TaxID=947309 RepID=UPI0013B3BEE5|nr:hypothetical protein [Pedobacter jeongneungensis]
MNKRTLLLISIFFTQCTTRHAEQWQKITIDPKLPRYAAFSSMKKQIEAFFNPLPDTIPKASNDVTFFAGNYQNKKDTAGTKNNHCEAYYKDSDTLFIRIGKDGILGGNGFTISCKNENFNTKGYLYSDMVYMGKVNQPQHWVIYQKLTLDKKSYRVGDSLYGKIDFKAMERNEIGDTILYKGNGNFRVKVEKLIMVEPLNM